MSGATKTRRLILILGDQLSHDSTALRDADPDRDVVAMAEVAAEIQRYPNHKQRVVLFLSAMRHFRDELRQRGFEVAYQEISDDDPAEDLPSFLKREAASRKPETVAVLEPGRFELVAELKNAAEDEGAELEVLPDESFLASHEDFEEWASGRKSLTMEYFYRSLRRRTGLLMDGDEPAGGSWNFDKENRESFGKEGPRDVAEPLRFEPDELTRQVMDEVEDRFPELPGDLASFGWPVTAEQGREALEDFVEHRLATFGSHQDAMWKGRPFLSHSLLAAALNLKLIEPRQVLERAVEAYEAGTAPINGVEGFVRQILGWREFLRGVYWSKMPDYLGGNALEATEELPELYWTGETEMACLGDVVGQLLDHGYAHHIQRLMVAGLFAQLLGVRPQEVHDWFMALYVDSVEWVTLPNTVGMSQYADGGVVGSKPYIASGKYIDRMSNYCEGCRFDPGKATGEDACPFTTLYWDFLQRHEERFTDHHRMGLQVRNLKRKGGDELEAISRRADEVRQRARKGRL